MHNVTCRSPFMFTVPPLSLPTTRSTDAGQHTTSETLEPRWLDRARKQDSVLLSLSISASEVVQYSMLQAKFDASRVAHHSVLDGPAMSKSSLQSDVMTLLGRPTQSQNRRDPTPHGSRASAGGQQSIARHVRETDVTPVNRAKTGVCALRTSTENQTAEGIGGTV